MVSVQSVKNGKSHSPIGGISVAVKSAKGEIRVSENRTLGLRRCRLGLRRCMLSFIKQYLNFMPNFRSQGLKVAEVYVTMLTILSIV